MNSRPCWGAWFDSRRAHIMLVKGPLADDQQEYFGPVRSIKSLLALSNEEVYSDSFVSTENHKSTAMGGTGLTHLSWR